MYYLLCPGIHPTHLTTLFVRELTSKIPDQDNLLILPTEQYPPFSAFHILDFLRHQLTSTEEITFISFSAGVVGAIGAAWFWQHRGGKIRAFIALDGWGVPLGGNFPIYRLSHDEFTHWSSALLGGGEISFYADPAVEHLDLWRSPAQVRGWQVQGNHKQRTNALEFMVSLLTPTNLVC